MSDKYIIDEEGEYLIDTETNDMWDATGGGDGIYMLVKKVNKLLEENEQLKNEVYDWKASAEDYLKLGQSLKKENEKLKKEKEFWREDSCNCSNYLSILSMDCQIVQEAIYDLKNVIDVDTEASKLLDKLDDKFDELNQHRIKMYSR